MHAQFSASSSVSPSTCNHELRGVQSIHNGLSRRAAWTVAGCGGASTSGAGWPALTRTNARLPPRPACRPAPSCRPVSGPAPSPRRLACRGANYDNPALYSSEDAFSLSSYWNDRYKREGGAPFEWYRDYGSLEPVLDRHLDKSQPVLHVGVGTSRIQYQMHLDGFKSIHSVDYAPVCIEQLSALHANVPALTYAVADCRSMPEYADGAFPGGVLDKGTLDALLCGDSDEAESLQMLQECYRVLGPGAAYLQITYAPPRTRLRYLQRPGLDWAVAFWEVGQQGRREGPVAVADLSGEELAAFPKQAYSHFVYVCVKPAA